MCNATAISMIAQGIGGGLSGYGTYQQYQQSAAQQQYEAAQAVQNARLLKFQEANVQEQADTEKGNIGLQTATQMGSGRTGYATGNVRVDTGTPLTYSMEVAAQSEREKAAIQRQADLEKYALQQQRRSLLSDAYMLRKAARSTSSAGRFAAIGSLLGSGSSMVSTYSRSRS